jgi:hypothetical protein
MERIRCLLLQIGLTAIYLLVVTPLGWLARLRGCDPLASRTGPQSPVSCWSVLQIDSSDRALYLAMSGQEAHGGFAAVIRAYRALAACSTTPMKWVVLAAMGPWRPLASRPKDTELHHDLYVMF